MQRVWRLRNSKQKPSQGRLRDSRPTDPDVGPVEDSRSPFPPAFLPHSPSPQRPARRGRPRSGSLRSLPPRPQIYPFSSQSVPTTPLSGESTPTSAAFSPRPPPLAPDHCAFLCGSFTNTPMSTAPSSPVDSPTGLLEHHSRQFRRRVVRNVRKKRNEVLCLRFRRRRRRGRRTRKKQRPKSAFPRGGVYRAMDHNRPFMTSRATAQMKSASYRAGIVISPRRRKPVPFPQHLTRRVTSRHLRSTLDDAFVLNRKLSVVLETLLKSTCCSSKNEGSGDGGAKVPLRGRKRPATTKSKLFNRTDTASSKAKIEKVRKWKVARNEQFFKRALDESRRAAEEQRKRDEEKQRQAGVVVHPPSSATTTTAPPSTKIAVVPPLTAIPPPSVSVDDSKAIVPVVPVSKAEREIQAIRWLLDIGRRLSRPPPKKKRRRRPKKKRPISVPAFATRLHRSTPTGGEYKGSCRRRLMGMSPRTRKRAIRKTKAAANRREAFLRRKPARAAETIRKSRTIEALSSRNFKLEALVLFLSRVAVMKRVLTMDRARRRSLRVLRNSEKVGKELIASIILARRKRRWRSAIRSFKNHFVFYRLYRGIEMRKRATEKIRAFAGRIKQTNLIHIALCKYSSRIGRAQHVMLSRAKMETARIRLNFVQWCLEEARMVLSKCPFDSLREMETYRFGTIDEHEEAVGSFTLLLPTPEVKLRVLQSLVQRNVDAVRRSRMYGFRDAEKPMVLLSKERLWRLCIDAFRHAKKQELDLREEILTSSKFDPIEYRKTCARVNYDSLERVMIETKAKLKEFGFLSANLVLLTRMSSFVGRLARKRLVNRLEYPTLN